MKGELKLGTLTVLLVVRTVRVVYENAQIDLTFVCRHNNCGVTYVEIRFNDLSG